MNTLRLALRLLRRDWRAGELRVLVAALILAVGSVGTVGFFADRVKGALTTQANLLLGADIMISGDRPLPATLTETASRSGLATTPVIRFNSMVPPPPGAPADASAILTDVKAVGEGYPLRGSIALAEPGRPEGRVTKEIPKRGEAWPDTRLADRLGVKIGDRIAVGEATLTVTAVVQQEPEVAGIVFSLGPKLLVNIEDVPATNLLQPGNRATYRLLVAARDNAGQLDGYRDWLGRELKAGQRVESVRDLRPEIHDMVEWHIGLLRVGLVDRLAFVAVADEELASTVAAHVELAGRGQVLQHRQFARVGYGPFEREDRVPRHRERQVDPGPCADLARPYVLRADHRAGCDRSVCGRDAADAA